MKLKSKLMLGASLILSLTLVACNDEESKEKDTEEKDVASVEVENKYEGEKEDTIVDYILPSDVLTKFENKDSFYFVIGNAGCGACMEYKAQALREFSEEDGVKVPFIETIYLETNKAEADAFVKMVKNHLDMKFEATPTTYFVKDGKLTSAIVGAIDYKTLKENLKSNGFE